MDHQESINWLWMFAEVGAIAVIYFVLVEVIHTKLNVGFKRKKVYEFLTTIGALVIITANILSHIIETN